MQCNERRAYAAMCRASSFVYFLTTLALSERRSAPKGDSLDYLLQSDDSNAPLAPF
jgi:hypothetical protein